MFVNYIFDKGFVCRLQREFIKHNNKEATQLKKQAKALMDKIYLLVANKHLKTWSTSLVNCKLKPPVRMTRKTTVTLCKLAIPSVREKVVLLEHSYIASGMPNSKATLKQFGSFPLKLL